MTRRHPLRRWLSRHAYAWIIIALLGGILLHRLTHPAYEAADLSPLPAPHPAYADTPVHLAATPAPLGQLLADLAAQARTPLDLRWPPAPADDNPAEVVTPLGSGNMSLADAIAATLAPTAGRLTVAYENQKIVIGTPDELDGARRTQVVVYPVEDLLNLSDPWFGPVTANDMFQQLIEFIESLVQPDLWRDRGGMAGSIRVLDGTLVITATPDMHDQIQMLLAQLRARVARRR